MPSSRAEQIESDESAKAQGLNPDIPKRDERRFIHAEKDADDILEGSSVRLQLGGLPMPSGLALGPTVKWQSSTDEARASAWGIGSMREFYNVGLGFELPHLTSQRFDVTFEAAHLDLPQLDFYGEGPNSLKSQRTDYRREDTRFDLAVDWPLLPHLTPNCKAEQLLLNVGPGTREDVTSTDLKFTPDQAPGLDVQSDFFIAGCGVRFDFLDAPDYPRKGIAASLAYKRFAAEQNSQDSFNRVHGVVDEYIPFLNEKRVIALHAASDIAFHNENQVVPFYMQSTLGSFADLRGFRPLRFYDENSLALSVEYRWEICTGFDMALFEDAGEVFHRPLLFRFDNLETSSGFGLRFNNRGSTAMRMDTGFGREGFQIWLTFNKAF